MNNFSSEQPLSFGPKEKLSFYRVLGLDRFAIAFQETSGGLVLRSALFREGEAEALLSPWLSSDEWGLEAEARLRCSHPKEGLGEEGYFLQGSLWESLFPFPISQLSRRIKRSVEVEISPIEIASAFATLANEFDRFEQRLSANEISYIWLANSAGGIGLVTHYVRKTRIALGVLRESNLTDLLQGEPSSEPPSASSAFFQVSIETRENFVGQIQAVGAALGQARVLYSNGILNSERDLGTIPSQIQL